MLHSDEIAVLVLAALFPVGPLLAAPGWSAGNMTWSKPGQAVPVVGGAPRSGRFDHGDPVVEKWRSRLAERVA